MTEKSQPAKEETRLQGIAVSGGIAQATVHLQGKNLEKPAQAKIAPENIGKEHQRLKAALATTQKQVAAMQESVREKMGAEHAAIFDAHLLALEDITVLEQVRKVIDEGTSADYALWSVMERYIEALRATDDDYLRERVIDIEDVRRRVLGNLNGESGHPASPRQPHILAAHDLTPSDTAMLDRELVLGFVTEAGGTTSHTVIIARSLGIPAVVGIPNLDRHLDDGDPILLDGYGGLIIVNPTDETRETYRQLQEEKGAIDKRILGESEAKAQTLDGKEIILSANIEFPHETGDVLKNNARGVGLFRTEFAYLQGALPSEEQLTEEYSKVTASLAPDLVIFRTIDLGGDKLDPGGSFDVEPNPFLGWRGIRYCLQCQGLFREQLRALLRASAHGKAGIMFPLVSNVDEVTQAKEILQSCMDELAQEGTDFDPDIQVGAMIEIPSAAVTADLIAPHVDFFSIGTNDLVQYSLAVDRINESVAHLYHPTHPAVLRLIHHTCQAAQKAKIWTGICGEMASDLSLTPLLIGLGLDELSVAPAQVPRVRYAMRKLDSAACAAEVKRWFDLPDPQDIYDQSHAIALQAYPELLS